MGCSVKQKKKNLLLNLSYKNVYLLNIISFISILNLVLIRFNFEVRTKLYERLTSGSFFPDRMVFVFDISPKLSSNC